MLERLNVIRWWNMTTLVIHGDMQFVELIEQFKIINSIVNVYV